MLQARAVEIVFRVFARRWHVRWRSVAEDPKARDVWLADLRGAGLSDADVKRGIVRTRELEWPPSVGEFIHLARPSPEDLGIPSLERAFVEACRGLHPQYASDQHRWSHPTVFHAAKAIGGQRLCFGPQDAVRKEFSYQLDVMVRRFLAGEQLDVPVPRALPERVHVETRDGPQRQAFRRWLKDRHGPGDPGQEAGS